jgi:hypothetical protein
MINAMKKDVNDVMYELGNKITPEWNSLPADQKRNGLAAWAQLSSQAIENIRKTPKALSNFGVPPPPPPTYQMGPGPR